MGGGHRLLFKGQGTLIISVNRILPPNNFFLLFVVTRTQAPPGGKLAEMFFLRKLNFLTHLSYSVLYVGMLHIFRDAGCHGYTLAVPLALKLRGN